MKGKLYGVLIYEEDDKTLIDCVTKGGLLYCANYVKNVYASGYRGRLEIVNYLDAFAMMTAKDIDNNAYSLDFCIKGGKHEKSPVDIACNFYSWDMAWSKPNVIAKVKYYLGGKYNG